MKIADGTNRSEKDVAKMIWRDVIDFGLVEQEKIESLVIGKKVTAKQRATLNKFLNYYKDKFAKLIEIKK